MTVTKPTPDRRAILGGSLALASAVAASAAPAADVTTHPDAGLLALGRQWAAIQREWEQPGDGETDAEGNERTDRESAILDAIAAYPAATFAGLAVKARILARESECEASVCLGDAGLTAWAASMLSEKIWLDRIVGALVIDLLRLGGSPTSASEAA